MERNWTKRNLFALCQGEVEVVRQWQSQYGRFVYTWLYYHLNKDESLAADLTGQILSQALRELSAFDPEQTTMYLWLKDTASRHLQTVLTRSGLKIQRPWAWSEIPPKILDSLKRIRNEALIPEASGCGAVVEMVQAALADLSEQDRDLLIRRYARLDTVEHIAAAAGLSAEKVNQQLYLARHAFRRGLFFLLQSANPDVVEPSVSGGMELFESNLETLLRSVNPAAGISSDSSETIKRAVLGAAAEVAQNPSMPAASANHKALKTALAAGGVLVMAAVIVLWMQFGSDVSVSDEPTPPETVQTPPDPVQRRQQTPVDQEELKRVLDFGVRGDIAGLLEILKNGGYISQVTAAHYLSQQGDESAIGPLVEAQLRWFPDEPQMNPFVRAVEDILERLGETEAIVEPAVGQATETEPEPEELTPEPAVAAVPPLSGRVVDYSGSPLAGVSVTLHRDSAAPGGLTPVAGLSTTTREDGRYDFERLPEGLCVVAVRDSQDRIAQSRRMMWAVKDHPSVLDFGGSAAVSGAILIDDAPLAERTVLLCDHFENPGRGVFSAETSTDADGGFAFTGVPAGLYGLFSRIVANRWTLLGQVEIARADVSVLLDWPTVTLVVQADELPESLRIVGSSLRYSADSSDALAEWAGVRTETDTVFEINGVIPGVYTLCVDFSNGVRMLRDVVVSAAAEQSIFIDEIPFGSAGMAGRFLSQWPEGLTLECAEPPIRISVMPEEDGYYELGDLPAATYSLGASVNGIFVPYLEFGLFEEQPAAYDPDPVQLAASRSPLYIYVTDAQGRGLAGGQVWLTGDGGFYTAYPFGRGYFAAAPPGSYTLVAAVAGHSAVEQQVSLPVSTLQAPQSEANTRVIRLDP